MEIVWMNRSERLDEHQKASVLGAGAVVSCM